MAPATKEAPKEVDLFAGTGITCDDGVARLGRLQDDDSIRDVGQADAIDAAVGRPGHVSDYTETECLLAADPSDPDRRDFAVLDRYYFPTDAGEEPVLVDVVSGGVERADQEAEKNVATKRQWCEKRGVKYIVVVDDETYS